MIDKIKKNYFILIITFLIIYFFFNLFDGNRGLISYFEKKNQIIQLTENKLQLINELKLVEKKNKLLTEIVDQDYLETLYRKKFMVGKVNERVFVSTKNED